MTETKITEFVVGVFSSWIFLWLFPVAAHAQVLVSTIYSVNISNTPLIISAASLVFSIGMFGLVSIYCLGACLEKITFVLIEYRRKKKC